MKTRRVNEGEWFAIPLRNGGYGVGIVARKGKRGVLFGYFFGPRHDCVPTIDSVRDLRPEDAIFCEQFGDLGIRRGEWPALGRLDTWDRSDWPMPDFSRIDEATGLAWIVRYPDGDPSGLGEERRCSIEQARRLPPDGLSGYGAVELLLTDKLKD